MPRKRMPAKSGKPSARRATRNVVDLQPQNYVEVPRGKRRPTPEVQPAPIEPPGRETVYAPDLRRWRLDRSASSIASSVLGFDFYQAASGVAPQREPAPEHAPFPLVFPPRPGGEKSRAEAIRPTQVLDVRVILDDDGWMTAAEHGVRYPSGTRRRVRVTHSRTSVVVVALTAEGQVLTVRQWKHGIGRITQEFPAGYLEHEREDPLAAGQRELSEETGYESATWLYLGEYFREPGRGRSSLHVAVALDARPVGGQRLDATEEIDVARVTLDEVETMMRDGRMPGLHCLGAWAIARPHVLQYGGAVSPKTAERVWGGVTSGSTLRYVMPLADGSVFCMGASL